MDWKVHSPIGYPFGNMQHFFHGLKDRATIDCNMLQAHLIPALLRRLTQMAFVGNGEIIPNGSIHQDSPATYGFFGHIQ